MQIKYHVIAFVYAVTSAVIGMFLSLFVVDERFPHPINFLWSSIYGVGWFLAGLWYGIRSSDITLFGSLIWPVIVICLVTAFFGGVLRHYPKKRKIILAFAIISLFILLPKRIFPEIVLRYAPLYSQILEVVY